MPPTDTIRPIYLDGMATTRLDPAALAAMLPYLEEDFGNASSRTHAYGAQAAVAVEAARREVAHLVGAAYEWGHHVEIGLQAGLTDGDIARVGEGPGASWDDDVDRLVIQACDDVHRDGLISDDTWNGLTPVLSEQQMVELPVLIGHYRMLAVVLASLGVQSEGDAPPLPPA